MEGWGGLLGGWMDDGRMDIYEGIADKRMDGLQLYIYLYLLHFMFVFFAAISYFALFFFLSVVFFPWLNFF